MSDDKPEVFIAQHQGIRIDYVLREREFRATVGQRIVTAATENALREKIEQALTLNRAENRPKVPAQLVIGHLAPIRGTFRGFHGRLGNILFNSVGGEPVETKERYSNMYLFPATADLDALRTLAREIAEAEAVVARLVAAHRATLESLNAKTYEVRSLYSNPRVSEVAEVEAKISARLREE